MIFAAVPGESASSRAWPAPISPTTGSTTGDSSLAPATSAATTAYPSIAELSKLGSAISETTSSAAGRPRASSSGWGYAGSGPTAARIRVRCSSTVTTVDATRASAIRDGGGLLADGAVGVDALGAGLLVELPHRPRRARRARRSSHRRRAVTRPRAARAPPRGTACRSRRRACSSRRRARRTAPASEAWSRTKSLPRS